MPAEHRTIRRAGALALGALFLLTGCGPTDNVAAPLESVAQTSSAPATSTAAIPPSPSAKPTPTKAAAGTGGGGAVQSPCPLGSKLKDVETALAKIGTYGPIVADGKLSAGDCAT